MAILQSKSPWYRPHKSPTYCRRISISRIKRRSQNQRSQKYLELLETANPTKAKTYWLTTLGHSIVALHLVVIPIIIALAFAISFTFTAIIGPLRPHYSPSPQYYHPHSLHRNLPPGQKMIGSGGVREASAEQVPRLRRRPDLHLPPPPPPRTAYLSGYMSATSMFSACGTYQEGGAVGQTSYLAN